MDQDIDLSHRLSPGKKVGGYRITRHIGRGGMADVYEAEDVTLGRRVALKVPRPDIRSKHQNERFLKEARKAALVDHQNVITIYAAGESDGQLYLVMQLVEGQDLSQLIRSYESAVPWYLALKVIRLAARGLHAVHQQGLVHRDIKPSNIMLASGPNVFVMDFGLVRDGTSTLTTTGDVLGTPPYMSPEQCRGGTIDHRSDIYSLGATLYSLVTGRRPFDGSTLLLVRRIGEGKRPTPVQKWAPTLPDDVVALIEKSMAVRARNRFADAQEMSREVAKVLKRHKPDETETWENTNALNTQPEKQGDSPAPIMELLPLSEIMPSDSLPSQRRQWVVGGAVLLLSILGLAIIALSQSGGRDTVPPAVTPANRLDGMVLVPTGPVRLGNEETSLRRYLGQLPIADRNVDAIVATCLESPTDSVEVDAFWIDQYEVTNADYAKFLKETGHGVPSHWVGNSIPTGKEGHPIVDITYADAQAYAEWCGKQLPTREQWTRAFRGDTDHFFPWGDTYEATWINTVDTPRAGAKTTNPVESMPRDLSQFEVYNLTGNVSEFVRGTYFHRNTPYRMVKGASFKVMGSIYGLAPHFMRYAMDVADEDTGFRCVIESD